MDVIDDCTVANSRPAGLGPRDTSFWRSFRTLRGCRPGAGPRHPGVLVAELPACPAYVEGEVALSLTLNLGIITDIRVKLHSFSSPPAAPAPPWACLGRSVEGREGCPPAWAHSRVGRHWAWHLHLTDGLLGLGAGRDADPSCSRPGSFCFYVLPCGRCPTSGVTWHWMPVPRIRGRSGSMGGGEVKVWPLWRAGLVFMLCVYHGPSRPQMQVPAPEAHGLAGGIEQHPDKSAWVRLSSANTDRCV